MEALRRVEYITSNKLVVEVPDSFLGKQVEIIVLAIDEANVSDSQPRLPVELKNSGTVVNGDLLDPVVGTTKRESFLSPFDVPGIKTKATTQDILDAVRDSRMD